MRIVKQKQGQFIIIAALLIAIMMVSVSTVMYGAVTYYRHERWEEYLAIIDNIELGSRRVVEISLANCSLTEEIETLEDNLYKWQNDTKKAYAGFGVVLTPIPAEGECDAYGVRIEYNKGLALDWYNSTAFSAANATFNINLTSVGLRGYKFATSVFLRMNILDALWDGGEKELTVLIDVDKENLAPVTGLREDNFPTLQIFVGGQWKYYLPGEFTLFDSYDEDYGCVYKILLENVENQPSLVSVTAIDTRSIRAIANSTVNP